MGWIQDQFKKRIGSGETEARQTAASETRSVPREEQEIEDVWGGLLEGFRRDVEEFQKLAGDCDFQQLGELQCRISNPTAKMAVLVTADLSAHTVEYSYQSNDERTAVPEGGILTLRRSNHSVHVYSADQRLTSEQARRMILQPLLFPASPTELAPTG